jgi:hypothetical protein
MRRLQNGSRRPDAGAGEARQAPGPDAALDGRRPRGPPDALRSHPLRPRAQARVLGLARAPEVGAVQRQVAERRRGGRGGAHEQVRDQRGKYSSRFVTGALSGRRVRVSRADSGHQVMQGVLAYIVKLLYRKSVQEGFVAMATSLKQRAEAQ